jgi:hypothetical protein
MELWIEKNIWHGIDRAFVNTVTKFRAPWQQAIYGPAERQLASQA